VALQVADCKPVFEGQIDYTGGISPPFEFPRRRVITRSEEHVKMKQKRIVRWSIATGVLISLGLLNVEQGYAADKKCTLATLKGQYLVAASGTLFPPAFGVTAPSVSTAAGYSIYNGDGTGTDYVTFTVNGVNQNVASPTPTSYTLGPDCTGTKTVLPYGPHFNIFVAYNGEGLTAIATDSGFAAAESDKRVGPSQ
jgi:hypothetical protein